MPSLDSSAHDVYGVDFSGAADAGERVWIAAATVDSDGCGGVGGESGASVRVRRCESAAERFGTTGRAATHEALVDALCECGPATVGVDAPFSLPREVVDAPSWETFVREFGERFDDPAAFREACLDRADGEYRRRGTEASVGALCPYGLRVHEQTFYVVRDVLSPLLGDVSVLPVNAVDANPTLLEVYPAAVLERFALFVDGYKGPGERETRRRRRNFEALERCTDLEYADREALCETVVENAGGDALDAILAAYAAYDCGVAGDPLDVSFDELGGYVYG